MKTIWKFQCGTQVVDFDLPEHSTPIFVGIDPTGTPAVWFEVDPARPRKKTRAQIIGTGHEIPPASNHCGSFVESPFVWHVYLSRLTIG